MGTNFQRSVVFGPHVEPGDEPYFLYDSILSTDGTPVRGIYHSFINNSETTFTEFGVLLKTNNVVSAHESIARPNFAHCPPFGAPNRDWYLSIAPLEHVVSLRVCQDDSVELRPCIGIILRYDNGREEALGQVRPDIHLSDVLGVENCEFQETVVDGQSRIYFRLKGSNVTEGVWIDLPRNGLLLWWFGIKGNTLHRVEVN
jgi:hypothetical protein